MIRTTSPASLYFPLMGGPPITGDFVHTGSVFSIANGKMVSTPSSLDKDFLFLSSGTPYKDGNLWFKNTTTNGLQTGNAAIVMVNAVDEGQIGALFGNMTSTLGGNSLGAVEQATFRVGLGDIGGPTSTRFHYEFGISVLNGPYSADFPNASYDPFAWDGRTGNFIFRDHLSRPSVDIDAEAHVFNFQGITNLLQIYGGAGAGDPMVIAAAGGATVGIVVNTGVSADLAINTRSIRLTADFVTLGANPTAYFNKTASGGANSIFGQTNGVSRWVTQFGNASAESGANAGSDFAIGAYADDGSFLGFPLILERATSKAIFSGKVTAPTSTTARASLNAAHGAAPSSPIDGDIWTTTAGLFVRINGSTVGPLS